LIAPLSTNFIAGAAPMATTSVVRDSGSRMWTQNNPGEETKGVGLFHRRLGFEGSSISHLFLTPEFAGEFAENTNGDSDFETRVFDFVQRTVRGIF
jgi:hypothetical protein